ncbi:MAG: NifU family protein [Rickettsiales bacterium]|jgi:Fe-S cluster biogenesis protein NfuA|nr:NifU family protein [Rickettsiales bacterium]
MNKEDKIIEIKKQIKENIRPMLVMDGGNIEFVEYTDDDVLKVKLLGHCDGCAMASLTLNHAVFEFLREYVPELKKVIAIDFEGGDLEVQI